MLAFIGPAMLTRFRKDRLIDCLKMMAMMLTIAQLYCDKR